jgi:AcrR family transcriptional regulator
MTDDRPPNKRQLQAAATRERMLNAAREVFEERGYRAATVGAITAAADTAHGTFYLYFKNKDDAFAQVMTAVARQLRDAQPSEPGLDRWEGIEAALRGFLDVFVQHPGLWRALLEGMLLSQTIEQMWLEIRARFVDRLAMGLEREQASGAVRALDVRQTALAMASMAEWYSFTHLVLGAEHSNDEGIDVAVSTLTDVWYHAAYGTTDRTRPPSPRGPGLPGGR